MIRSRNPAAYEQMLLQAERGRLPDFEEVPDDVERGLTDIRLGQTLGVPAPEVAALPLHWRRDALLTLELDELAARKAQKERR